MFIRQTAAAILLAGLSLLSVPTAQAQETWKIVVPWRPQLVTVDVPVLFARELTQELQSPVVVDDVTYNKQDEALSLSLESAQSQPRLVLFSEELALLDAGDRQSPRHLSHYEPVMLIWQTRWCLFTLKDSKIQQPEALKAWVQDGPAVHKVAIPEAKGRLSIWVRGLEQRTHRKWDVHTYGLKGSIVQFLENDVDVALSYCNRQRLHPEVTRVVAQSGPMRSDVMPDVPLFTEVGWAPLEKGWMAWMVPKATPVAQREQMAQALYRVMGKANVQTQLRGTGHVVQHMDARMSKQHIEAFSTAWQGIHELLDDRRKTVY